MSNREKIAWSNLKGLKTVVLTKHSSTIVLKSVVLTTDYTTVINIACVQQCFFYNCFLIAYNTIFIKFGIFKVPKRHDLPSRANSKFIKVGHWIKIIKSTLFETFNDLAN